MRAGFISKVHEILERPPELEVIDFEFTEVTIEGKETLTITYRPHPEYTFTLVFGKQDIWSEERPGTIRPVDTKGPFNDNKDIFTAINGWAQRLTEDIAALPALRRVALVEQELAKYADWFDQLPEQFLSVQEAEEIKARLTKLEEHLAQQIRATTTSQAEVSREIEELHREIEHLKEQTTTANQQGLFRLIAARIGLRLATNNPKTLATGTHIALQTVADASRLLPSEIGEPVSDAAGQLADVAAHLANAIEHNHSS